MPGEADSLTLTLGYFASATVCPIASSTLLSFTMAAVTPMWSMINVSCGCCSAMGPSSATRPGAKHMTGSPAFSAAPQNQSAVPSESQGIVCALLKVTRTPSTPSCSFHFGSRSARLGILQRDAAHDAEAGWIALHRLERIVVAVARPGRRDDHGAIHAGLVHHRHEPFDDA